MARLIVWNLVTFDGSFEGTDPWGPDLEKLSLDQLHPAGCLLFGRRT